MPVPNDIQELRDRDDIDEIKAELLEYGNVESVGIGYRFKDGGQTDEPALIVSVYPKVEDENELDDDDVIPTEVNGVSVDVYGLGQKPKEQNERGPARNGTMRPVPGGAMMSRERDGESSGVLATLGMLVWDMGNNETAILVAAHTTHEDEDNVDDLIGKGVYQPTYDEDYEQNRRIGEVLEIEYDSLDYSGQDWATINLVNVSDWRTNHVLGCGKIGTYREPDFDQPVVFSGSGGDGNGIRKTEMVSVDNTMDGLENLYEYRNNTEGGDSGSIVGQFDSDGVFRPFALHVISGSYGVDLDVILNERADLRILTSDSYNIKPELDEDEPAHFEAAIVREDHKRSTATATVFNGGGEFGVTQVDIIDEDDNMVDTKSVALESLDYRLIDIDLPQSGEYRLQTRDIHHPHRDDEDVELAVEDIAEYGPGTYLVEDGELVQVDD